MRDAGSVLCRGSFWSAPRLSLSARGEPLPDRSPRAHLAPEHGHGSVPANWVFKTATSLQHTFITLAVRDEDGRWARPGLAETGAPGTAVTLCHCGRPAERPSCQLPPRQA